MARQLGNGKAMVDGPWSMVDAQRPSPHGRPSKRNLNPPRFRTAL